MKRYILRTLFFALLLMTAGQAMAIAPSNPRVKFIYESEHGTAFASGADNDGKVTITITPDGDWRCINGDVTAKVTANTNMAQAPRRAQAGVQLGDAIDVTFEETNVFTLTLPEDENLNATVTISFSEKLDNDELTVAIDGWTYGEDAKTPQVENNQSSNGPTYTYSNAENGDYSSTVPYLAGTYWVKASVDADADYKAGEAKTSFIIEQKTLTITAGDATKLYDGYELTKYTYTNTDLAEGDRIDAVTITGSQTEVGESNNVPSNAVIKNSNNEDVTASYAITYVNGKLTVEDVSVKFSVVDIANGGAIAGATIQLKDGDDNILKEWTSSTDNYTVNGLCTGKQFTVHETIAPDGYTLADDFTFTVNADGSIETNGVISEGVLLVENSKTKVKISVVDTDSGEAIAGTTVQVKESEETVVEEWTSTTDVHEIEGLTTGVEYTIHETGAPNGYLISRDYTFTISETGQITYTGNKVDSNVLLVENKKTGDLELSKTLVSDLASDADAEFTFTVTLGDNTINGTYGDMTFENGEATVELKGGESAITSLPTGTTYTITEAPANGFQLTGKTGDTGTISTTKSSARFTNTRETGDLELSKVLVSDLMADADAEFTFTVTLGDNTISGTYGGMTFTNGVATVQLKGGESTIAEGLPTCLTYTITEAEAEGFELTGKTGDEGTISTTKSTAVFTNTRETGDLELSKTLVSDLASDADAEFTFTVTLGDNTINGTYGGMTFTNGVATIQLKGGESTVAEGLPTSLTYTITEADAEGFQLTGKAGYEGTISTTKSTATFTNTRKTGNLILSNIVYTENNDEDFEFTVRLDDTTINGTYGEMTFTDGVATFTLKGGESATATGLPTSLGYTVTQTEKTGYQLVDQTGIEGVISDEPDAEVCFYNVQLTEATVKIEWDDADNQDGKRPESVTATMKANDTDTDPVTEITLNADNNWTATVSDLLIHDYSSNTDIIYSWSCNTPDDYDGPREYESGTTTTLTFSYEPETIDAKVSAVWVDTNDQDGYRPDDVTINLVKNGTIIDTVTLSDENNWTYSWTGLDKYSDGQVIDYTVTENAVAEYTINITKATDGTFTYTITNTHVTEKVDVDAIKVWDDNDNAEGFRPNDVTINLLADGKIIDTVILSEENDWKYNWTGLAKKADGQVIDYTITENAVAQYSPHITKDNEDSFTYTVTNSRTIEKTSASIVIVWDDNDDAKGLRPESVSAKLFANSDEAGAATLDADNSWQYTWDGLQKYENATEIVYTSELVSVPDNYVLMSSETSGDTKTLTLGLQTVTLSSTSATYTGTDQKPTVTVTVGSSSIDEDAYTVSYKLGVDEVNECVNSGTYTVIVTDKEGGYNLCNAEVTFTIVGKPVTVIVKNDKDEDVEVPAATGDATITEDQNGITLTLITSDENTAPQAVEIPQAVNVDHIEILRLFANGRAATVYLPFAIEVGKITGGTFHTFTSVDETTTPWTVNYSDPLASTAMLEANTPYIFLPDGSNGGKLTVNNTAKVTVCTANPHATTQGMWEFIGTNSPIVWDASHQDLGRVFGFAAEDKTVDGTNYEIGQFVRVGAGASIASMRAYLKYTSTTNAPAHQASGENATNELPKTMRVVIGSGNVTAIDTLDMNVGDSDDWYSINGQKLSGKPTAKGIYIHNGVKVGIK